MDKYTSTMENTILHDILEIEGMECGMLQKSKLIVSRLEETYEALKHFISGYSFLNELEEIRFFKEVKPRFFSLLIYYSKVYNIELRMPAGSTEDKRNHLVHTQERIRSFFDMNLELYEYYRSGSNHFSFAGNGMPGCRSTASISRGTVVFLPAAIIE